MRHIWLCLTAILVLVSGRAQAADGDFVRESTWGVYRTVEWLLCDGAPANCSELNITTKSRGGMPDFLVLDIRKDNCTTPNTIIPRGLSEAAGAAHTLHAGLTSSGSSSLLIDPSRFFIYDATMSGGSGGTCDDVEVVLRAFYSQSPPTVHP